MKQVGNSWSSYPLHAGSLLGPFFSPGVHMFLRKSVGVRRATRRYFREYRVPFPCVFLVMLVSSWTSCFFSTSRILSHFPATRCQHVVDAAYLCVNPVVGIAISYGLDKLGFGVPCPGGVKNFLFSISSRPALGSSQPIQRLPGDLSPWAKLPGREADH
jgi:hypothetical protein